MVVGPRIVEQAVGAEFAQAVDRLRLREEDPWTTGTCGVAVRPFGAQHARTGVTGRDFSPTHGQTHKVRVAAVAGARLRRAARAVVTHGAQRSDVNVLGVIARGAVTPEGKLSVAEVVARRTASPERALTFQDGGSLMAGLAVEDGQRAGAQVAARSAVTQAGTAAVMVGVAKTTAEVGHRWPSADLTQHAALRHLVRKRAIGQAGSPRAVAINCHAS